MRTSCSQIAWGLGLTLFDLRIGGFDLLPDVLGFILILIGLSGLAALYGGFVLARSAALVLLIASVAELIGFRPPSVSITTANHAYSFEGLSTVALLTICTLAMLYGLCEGCAQLAIKSGRRELARSFRAAWMFNFVLGATMLFVLPFGLNGHISFLVGTTILTGLGQLAAGIWVIVLVRRLGRGPQSVDHVQL